ncbi:FRG domain-containing protein [Pseudomonas pergaminensis]
MTNSFKEEHFNDAVSFMEYLSPMSAHWNHGTYIFRGHGDAAYTLTPSACRRGAGSFADGSALRAIGTSSAHQIFFEMKVLKTFLAGCDNAGLIVPGYNELMKESLVRMSESIAIDHSKWPPRELFEVLAVAQHHGVPTRLLDWSRRSYVAAYFAATSASYHIYESRNIAVWALDISQSHNWTGIKIINPPGGTSRNLAAQSGVFTMQQNFNTYEEHYHHIPLENVDELYSGKNEADPHSLIKITLPIECVPLLVTLCSKFGVSGSMMFPGYEGVAKDVNEWAREQVGLKFYRCEEDEDPTS